MIGGYTVGGRDCDALIFGCWEGDRLMYAARTRRGFTPAVGSSCTRASGAWRRPSVRSRISRKRGRGDGVRA